MPQVRHRFAEGKSHKTPIWRKKGMVIKMQQVIYADILFVINFSMDFLAFYILSYILKLPFKKGRMFLSAAIGALYSVCEVVVHNDNIPIAIVVAALMCFIGFGKSGLGAFARQLIGFISVNFLLGGGMTAIFSVFNAMGHEQKLLIYGELNTVGEKLPFSYFVLGFAVISILSLLFAGIYSSRADRKKVSGKITYHGNTEEFSLLCDSGNLLTEPLSGDPVIFLSENAFLKLCGKGTLTAVKSADASFMKSDTKNIRLIVYETVGGSDMGICLRPERVKVGGKDVKAWITMGNRSNYGESEGIVPLSLVR